jgi:flagellar motility protein MotE (MotC chaperone)
MAFLALFMSFRVKHIIDTVQTKSGPLKNVSINISSLSAEKKEGESAPSKDPKKDSNAIFDPLQMDEGEVQLLLNLSKQRQALSEKENNLTEKELSIKALENTVDKKIEELKKLKEEIESLLKKFNKLDLQNTNRLTALYANMKPKDAARIMNDLPIDILLPVIQRIDAGKASAILAVLDKKRAHEITEHMVALQNVLPETVKKK